MSFDGHLTLEQIRDLARAEGFGAVFVTEHIEQLTVGDLEELIERCRRISSVECVLIPGIEIEAQCQYYLGLRRPIPTADLREARRQLLESGSVAVLAHPHRMKRPLSAEERSHIRAIEIWNVKDDGSRAPGYVGYRMWKRWSGSTSRPAPIAGVDLHDLEGFRRIGIELTVDRLDAEAMLEAVRRGAFRIWHTGSPFDANAVAMSDVLRANVLWNLRRTFRALRLKRVFPRGTPRTLKRLVKG
jgi:hypothetical protein